MDFSDNIKKAASWSNISPMVLDSLVYDFSNYVADNISLDYQGDAESIEQIEQNIFESIYDDKKTIDFAVAVINNLPEGHDKIDHVSSAMWDIVNDNEYDDDYVHTAVKKAYKSSRWDIDVEIFEDNNVSVIVR